MAGNSNGINKTSLITGLKWKLWKLWKTHYPKFTVSTSSRVGIWRKNVPNVLWRSRCLAWNVQDWSSKTATKEKLQTRRIGSSRRIFMPHNSRCDEISGAMQRWIYLRKSCHWWVARFQKKDQSNDQFAHGKCKNGVSTGTTQKNTGILPQRQLEPNFY